MKRLPGRGVLLVGMRIIKIECLDRSTPSHTRRTICARSPESLHHNYLSRSRVTILEEIRRWVIEFISRDIFVLVGQAGAVNSAICSEYDQGKGTRQASQYQVLLHQAIHRNCREAHQQFGKQNSPTNASASSPSHQN